MNSKNHKLKLAIIALFLSFIAVIGWQQLPSVGAQTPINSNSATPAAQPTATPAAAQAEPVEGCITCHGETEPMHLYDSKGVAQPKLKNGKDAQGMSCTACHGGNPAGTTELTAHVQPRNPEAWYNGKSKSANPERSNTLLNKESNEFVRFVNPGDFRVVAQSCGECHATENYTNQRSMMTHGAMLWGAALYNNGGFPIKDTRFGESYNEDGKPQALIQDPQPTRAEQYYDGILSFIEPLPRWEVSTPGNVLRVFERGGRRRLEVGLPDREEEPGKPDKGLSPRGFGTNNRTDPVYLGLQKTRLLDPTMNHLGTNDHAGDFRSSGCSSCHVVYANDRDPVHSAMYAAMGNKGETTTGDKTIPKGESGHPIKHQFTSRIPTSQCMVCHMHPGTNMVSTYLGQTWWDNETDGGVMYPEQQKNPTQAEEAEQYDRNPEGASVRGKWGDPKFLNETGTDEFNKKLKRTQFGDAHGHGWVFKKVYKKNRKGEMLDAHNNVLSSDDPDKFQKAVHLKDIHLERGMHCADCHFNQDNHGDGNLYNEPRAAVEIGCVDCHGSIDRKATLLTSSYGAKTLDPNNARDKAQINRRKTNLERAKIPFTDKDLQTGNDLAALRTRDANGTEIPAFQRIGRAAKRKDATGKEIELKEGDIVQNSKVEHGKWWKVTQTVDTVTPGNTDYSDKSSYAKTIQKDNQTWGSVPKDENILAHRDSNMTCYTCHTSWMTSCFGCHLSMEANRKMPNRHNEGGDSRNFTTYNFQVLRDDIFMLGKDGTTTGHRVAPVRSSSAVIVSSRNQNREWIYHQQQTVSAEGFAGQAFNTHVPHTVRGAGETKNCSDCHVSDKGDNNAWLAQVYLQGTNFVNFIGHYVYVAAGESLDAVRVTEHAEPQAVFGSNLHKLAYPDNFKKFESGGRKLKNYFEHVGNPEVLQVTVRGEYAYVAAGKGGLRVYDVAQIDHKGFSERIVTAPVSPFGQKFYVGSKHASAVAAPTTLGVDPARWRVMLGDDGKYKMVDPETGNRLHAEAVKAGKPSPMVNEEQPIHPLYAYLYVADSEEGLILVNAATLLDGDPRNNFLERAVTFNPDNSLTGANNISIVGNYAFITTDKALNVVSIDNPLQPKIVKQIALNKPKSVAVQFRYGFVVDADGLKVIDVSRLNDKPEEIRLIENALVPLKHAHNVYVARTYAYVADGEDGLAIIDVERAEQPRLAQQFNDGGKLNDAHDVKVAMTNASLYAYVADGKNGLKVLQLTDPETMPNYAGFSPKPEPRVIASFKTKHEALAISKGLDRDRAVDESGNQVAVFGRRGARPFDSSEMRKMLFTKDGTGEPLIVSDEPVPQAGGGQKTAVQNKSWFESFSSLWLFGMFGFGLLLIAAKVKTARRS